MRQEKASTSFKATTLRVVCRLCTLPLWMEVMPKRSFGVRGGATYYQAGLDRNGTYIVAQAVERLDPETGKRTLTSRLLAYTGSQKEILYDGNDRILYASRLGDVVLFTAGATLWKTNGTAEGTELVRSFPSSELSAWSVHDFRSFNGRVAISTESGIWLSDGTSSGTKLIPDSFPGSIYGFRDSLVVATFARGTHSRELQIIRDESVVDRVEIEGRSVGFTLLGEHLFIKTDCQLWRTNGTPGKTALIHEHNADRCIVSATERFVYVRSDTELFQIDAVSLEVRLVHEGRSITVAAVGRDYVIYRTSTDGGSVWRILSDETGVPQDFETKIGVTIDGVSSLDDGEFVVESGDSFWITDGTRIGTRKILSLSNWNEERDQQHLDPIVYAGRFHELGDRLLFTAAADGIGITTWGGYAVDLPPPSLPGDLRNDGVVDVRDFLVLARNFGKANALPEEGDLDGDEDIDLADFLILARNFGRIR